ncbi:MAG: PD-(D/E)XK nuclease family protein [Firmicutes bacterium]|nr:PD-(D/E)XK nuclease family protein [Bacillota bacterium]
MTTIYTHDNYNSAFEHIVKIVRNRTIDLAVNHLIIVPDKYTLDMERRIYDGTSGSMDCEVVTLSRMAVQSSNKVLSKTASIMIVKKIVLGRLRDKGFVAFGNSVNFAGFASKIFDTIMQFKRCLLQPDDIRQLGDIKLGDIADIYKDYLEYCTLYGFMDGGDKLNFLRGQILQDKFANCIAYIVNYDEFDKATQQLIQSLSNHTQQLHISTLASVDTSFVVGETQYIPSTSQYNGKLPCYIATDEIDEIDHIAKNIVYHAKQGIRFGDMGIVYGGNTSLLMQILERYDIPYNIEFTRGVDTFAISICLKNLISLYSHQYNKTTMLSLAHNWFVPLSSFERVKFVEYAYKYAVDYNGFLSVWNDENAELARCKMVKFVQDFFQILGADNSAELVTGLKSWVVAQEQLSIQLSKVAKQDTVRVLNSLLTVLNECEELFCMEESPKTCIKILLEALTASIGMLPHIDDGVMCGSPEVFRGACKQVVFVSTLNDGILPQVASDSGLISNAQIQNLQNIGVQLHPTLNALNRRARIELENILYSNAKIYLSCIDNNQYRPAYFLRQLEKTGKLEYSTYKQKMQKLNDSLDWDTMQIELSSPFAAKQALLRQDLTNNNLANACYYALGGSQTLNRFLDNTPTSYIPDSIKLMLGNSKVSASRIEQFMTCPYKHFLNYGLRLKEIEKGGTRPADIGSFLHFVLELFVKADCNLDKLDDILKKSLIEHDKLLLPTNLLIKERSILEARQLCKIVAEQLMSSSFVPLGTEIEFGDGLQYSGLDYSGIVLQGKIDRVDKYSDYVRLIDYKSGKADFSHKELYLGKKIQLLLYLYVFLQNGFRPAGSFYFPAKTRWDDDEYSYQLKGVYITEPNIVYALDNNLRECSQEHTSKKPNKSSIINCNVYWDEKQQIPKIKTQIYKAVQEETLVSMCNYANYLVERAINYIKDGFIKKSPLIASGNSPCNYCQFKSICLAHDEINNRECNMSVLKAEEYCC